MCLGTIKATSKKNQVQRCFRFPTIVLSYLRRETEWHTLRYYRNKSDTRIVLQIISDTQKCNIWSVVAKDSLNAAIFWIKWRVSKATPQKAKSKTELRTCWNFLEFVKIIIHIGTLGSGGVFSSTSLEGRPLAGRGGVVYFTDNFGFSICDVVALGVSY